MVLRCTWGWSSGVPGVASSAAWRWAAPTRWQPRAAPIRLRSSSRIPPIYLPCKRRVPGRHAEGADAWRAHGCSATASGSQSLAAAWPAAAQMRGNGASPAAKRRQPRRQAASQGQLSLCSWRKLRRPPRRSAHGMPAIPPRSPSAWPGHTAPARRSSRRGQVHGKPTGGTPPVYGRYMAYGKRRPAIRQFTLPVPGGRVISRPAR